MKGGNIRVFRHLSLSIDNVPELKMVNIVKNRTADAVACFVSNKIVNNQLIGLELFGGVRNDWSVESDNYVKDVTMGEDYIKCKYSHRIRAIASVFNLALNLIPKKNITNNIRLVREDFNFDRHKAKSCFARS
jgi:hypothetical protein